MTTSDTECCAGRDTVIRHGCAEDDPAIRTKHLIRKYNSVRTVRDILSLPPERDFKIMTRELSSVNEGDVGIGIREIWVHRERKIEFWFLDETNYKFPLEDYSPRAYR